MSTAWHCCQPRPPKLQIWCFTCQAPRPPFPFPWLQFSDKKNYTRPNLRYIFSLYVNIQMHDACVFLNPCFMVQGCFNPGYLFLWTFYNLQSCSSTYWYNSSKVLPRFHNQAGTICGTFVQHKSGLKIFVLFVFTFRDKLWQKCRKFGFSRQKRRKFGFLRQKCYNLGFLQGKCYF